MDRMEHRALSSWPRSACSGRIAAGGLSSVFHQPRASPLTYAMRKSESAGSVRSWHSFGGEFQGKCLGAFSFPLKVQEGQFP